MTMTTQPSGSSGERLRTLGKEVERLRRDRARLRASVSFRLGRHLTRAVQQPWRLLFLPISFPLAALNLGLERLGRRAPPLEALAAPMVHPRRHAVVLFPTNGVGFGHFTRMLALARRLRKRDPALEVVMFTTMPTLHIPYSEGIPTYHLAGRGKHDEMEASTWNGLVEDMLRTVLDVHRPHTFVFDGAFPYRGMLNAIAEERNMRAVWVRRGMLRKGSKVPVDSVERFDLIVHPGDGSEAPQDEDSEHDVPMLHTPPFLLHGLEELFPREVARRRLGLAEGKKVVYVQLGAGRINDITSEVRIVTDVLLKDPETQVVIGESMLGARLDVDLDRVILLRDYPNVMYLNAFDALVQAGGYNSFHEARMVRTPTLFLPNMNTGMDDQLARTMLGAEEGWAVINKDRSVKGLEKSIHELWSLKQGAPPPQVPWEEELLDAIALPMRDSGR